MSDISLRTRIAILTRDGYRCTYCGRTSKETILHVDHVLPRAHGGSNDRSNLVTACQDCNLGKSAELIALPETTDPEVSRSGHAYVSRWRRQAERRWPDGYDRAEILGDGRWALLSWCAILKIRLYDDQPAAITAWTLIHEKTCGHACRGDHEVVNLSQPAHLTIDVERTRRMMRSEHFEACADCGAMARPASRARLMKRLWMAHELDPLVPNTHEWAQ
jgi:hypothetical protein